MAIVVGVFALVLTGVGTPTRADAAGALQCADRPGDHVAVVIDFGDAPGAPNGVFSDCVPKTTDTRSGLHALRKAANGRVGNDASGKICQIMGIPSTFDRTNCSAPKGGKISYWAYFRGDGNSWTYSGRGAATSPASPKIVEGWRFVTVRVSQQTAAAEPPRDIGGSGASFRWQSTCPAASVPPPTRPSRPTNPRPGEGAGGSGAPAQAPGVADPGGGSAPQPQGSGRGSPESSGRSERSTTTTDDAGTTTMKPAASTTTTSTTVTDSTLEGTGGLRSSETAPRLSDDDVATAADAAAASSGRPIGAIVAGVGGGGAVVVALAMATRRSRRRRDASIEATDPDGPQQ